MKSITRYAAAAGLAIVVVATTACGDDNNTGDPKTPPKPSGSAKAAPPPPKPKPTAAATAPVPSNLPPLPVREFQESDFSETDKSRDPFRSFETMFFKQSKTKVTLQHEVLVDRFALDELELSGIVTRGSARVLLTDPTGLGWVAKVGDFVGKAEMVHSGGPTGTDVPINWRVDRIREGDVVFVREDASHPDIPPTTRVISLYPVEAASATGGRRGR